MKKSSWLLCPVALSVGSIAWTQAGAVQLDDPIDAVKRNDPDALRALIARAADIDATDADSSTALHWAVQRDDVDMASLLLDAGADPAATDALQHYTAFACGGQRQRRHDRAIARCRSRCEQYVPRRPDRVDDRRSEWPR